MKYNLMSYYYLRKNLNDAYFIKENSQLVIIDSGAHSFQKGTKVDWVEYTKQYAEFIKEFDEDKVVGYFEMDVDNILGYQKVLELRKILESVSDKIIPVWHKNRGIQDFKDMCKKYQGKVVATTINPIGYGVFQFRVSELMTVFPVHFKKARIGLLLGVAIANAMSPLGFIDVFCGTLTAGLLYYLIDRLPVHNYIKYILYSLEVGLIIGWELQLVYHMPFALTFFTTFIPEMILCIIGDLLAKKLKHYVSID